MINKDAKTSPQLSQQNLATQQSVGSSSDVNVIVELRNAFEVAERTTPGSSEQFVRRIFTRLQPGLSNDQINLAVERLKY